MAYTQVITASFVSIPFKTIFGNWLNVFYNISNHHLIWRLQLPNFTFNKAWMIWKKKNCGWKQKYWYKHIFLITLHIFISQQYLSYRQQQKRLTTITKKLQTWQFNFLLYGILTPAFLLRSNNSYIYRWFPNKWHHHQMWNIFNWMIIPSKCLW